MYNEDIEYAKKARLNAYSPYSNFQVGAALRTKSGKVYMGCNIENHGIQGICAERTAFAKALSEGEREFESITVVGANKGEEPNTKCMPCGYCRQFMSEFVDDNFKVCVVDENNSVEELTIKELLPYSFSFTSK
jgi:cytidine deaminase